MGLSTVFHILIFILLVENSHQLPNDFSQSPSRRRFRNCPKFQFGEIGPQFQRIFITVANYGDSTRTSWKMTWGPSTIMVDCGSLIEWFNSPDKQDKFFFSKCSYYFEHVPSSCQDHVFVLHEEGLLSAPCDEWETNPIVTFSVDVNFNETILNYTNLLKNMLDTYTKEYKFKVEDFKPFNYTEEEINYRRKNQPPVPRRVKTDQKTEMRVRPKVSESDQKTEMTVFLIICGGLFCSVGLYWCFLCFKFFLKKN